MKENENVQGDELVSKIARLIAEQVLLQNEGTSNKTKSREPKLTKESIGSKNITGTPAAEQIIKLRQERQKAELTQRVKKIAEDRGFIVTLNDPEARTGIIDVCIGYDDLKLPCLIFVSSDPNLKFNRITKCLAAGYNRLVIVSTNKDSSEAIRRTVADHLPPQDFQKVMITEVSGLIEILDSIIISQLREVRNIQGWKVKVEYQLLPLDEVEHRCNIIKRVLAKYNSNI